MRNMRTLGPIVLVSVVLAGVGQLVSTPANAALPAQLGMMGAAIHAGSCANPSPVPFALLNALAPAGSSDSAATPLFSNTDAPVPLNDLLSSPHAVLVTLGGDVDAMLVCGDLSGATRDGAFSVDLQEENASGYAGVALLSATGETTQVSVVLTQVSHQTPVAVSPTTLGPATPVSPVSPEATPRSGIPPIVLPPTVTIPSTTPVVEQPAAAGSPYVSEQFGYSIGFSAPWQLVSGPDVTDSTDFIELSDGASNVDFLGIAGDLTPSACMDTVYDRVILHGVEGLVLVSPHVGAEPTVSTPQEAVEVWDFSFVAGNGQRNDNTFYARCIVLVPGQSVLLITQETSQDAYPTEAALREELLQSLLLPQ
jgi:hypothetical protein